MTLSFFSLVFLLLWISLVFLSVCCLSYRDSKGSEGRKKKKNLDVFEFFSLDLLFDTYFENFPETYF